jgi:hypothetical protein
MSQGTFVHGAVKLKCSMYFLFSHISRTKQYKFWTRCYFHLTFISPCWWLDKWRWDSHICNVFRFNPVSLPSSLWPFLPENWIHIIGVESAYCGDHQSGTFTSNLSILYLSSTCSVQAGVVVYYLKPSSRSRALNTPVTSYSSHPIILSAAILPGCGFCLLALCQSFNEAVA